MDWHLFLYLVSAMPGIFLEHSHFNFKCYGLKNLHSN